MHFSLPTTVAASLPQTTLAPSPSEKWSSRATSHQKHNSSKTAYFTHILKRRRRTVYLFLFAILCGLVYLYRRQDEPTSLSRSLMPKSGGKAAPPVVIVVALDKSSMSAAYSKRILENRKRYADKWGYEIFARDLGEYEAGNEYNFKDGLGKTRHYLKSFNKLPMIRQAMSMYPYTKTFWFLSSDSLIINMDLSLHSHILSKERLNSLMLRDHPVIPPESIIKTFKRTEADDVQFIITQDGHSVKSDSFFIRRKKDEYGWEKGKGGKKGGSVYGYYLLDVWFDPLYRFYHFGDGETSALEHMIQWHPTILAKLAIIPQRIMMSYPIAAGGNGAANKKKDGKDKSPDDDVKAKYAGAAYEPGDFVVHFEKCGVVEKDKGCMKEFERYWKMTEKYKRPDSKKAKPAAKKEKGNRAAQ
ncbi:hypothetical protein H072_1030 [Dactylellina haptotyla CBS 200.50]|uniref:Uncharacterized protein n=1 Tax=Dactylellina haptotyla (strain CBS 200.50) TaxID=1284197 RepID=S8BZU6_DACHA|nr:hypothetical protein H072_1030 [Dactylellina haptotyla CBS 200.50]